MKHCCKYSHSPWGGNSLLTVGQHRTHVALKRAQHMLPQLNRAPECMCGVKGTRLQSTKLRWLQARLPLHLFVRSFL